MYYSQKNTSMKVLHSYRATYICTVIYAQEMSLRGFVGGWKFVMNVTARGIKYRELSKLWWICWPPRQAWRQRNHFLNIYIIVIGLNTWERFYFICHPLVVPRYRKQQFNIQGNHMYRKLPKLRDRVTPLGPILTYKGRLNPKNILIGQRWARTKCMSIWVLLTNRSAEVRSSALLDSFCQNSGAFVLPPGTPGKMRVIIFSIYTAMRAISSTRCDIICQLLVVPCRRKQVAGWTATSRTLLVVSLESRSFARTCINGYRYNE